MSDDTNYSWFNTQLDDEFQELFNMYDSDKKKTLFGYLLVHILRNKKRVEELEKKTNEIIEKYNKFRENTNQEIERQENLRNNLEKKISECIPTHFVESPFFTTYTPPTEEDISKYEGQPEVLGEAMEEPKDCTNCSYIFCSDIKQICLECKKPKEKPVGVEEFCKVHDLKIKNMDEIDATTWTTPKEETKDIAKLREEFRNTPTMIKERDKLKEEIEKLQNKEREWKETDKKLWKIIDEQKEELEKLKRNEFDYIKTIAEKTDKIEEAIEFIQKNIEFRHLKRENLYLEDQILNILEKGGKSNE